MTREELVKSELHFLLQKAAREGVDFTGENSKIAPLVKSKPSSFVPYEELDVNTKPITSRGKIKTMFDFVVWPQDEQQATIGVLLLGKIPSFKPMTKAELDEVEKMREDFPSLKGLEPRIFFLPVE